MKDYRYAIIEWPPTDAMVKDSIQTSWDTILRSNDGTKCLLKFKNNRILPKSYKKNETKVIKVFGADKLVEELEKGWDKPIPSKRRWQIWRK